MGISITIGGIFLYKSYAYYENEKEYNVIKGIIPDFSYDVKFAITVDDETKESIPTEPKDASKSNYYKVTADCDDGIKAEWDYNAWNLKVEDIQKGTKCKLAFNSELSEEDYKNYIEAGVAYRRNTYRGKDITSKLTDGSLFKEIESGKFDDIFVGDYIKTTTNKKNIIWLIADLDNYLHSGFEDLTQHHATIIPAAPLINAQMNSTNTTAGGYAGSAMVGYEVGEDGKATANKKSEGGTLDTILSTYIEPDFGVSNASNDNTDHIIEYSNLLTNQIDKTMTNRFSTSGGASINATWYKRKLDLMSEVNVYGTIAWSSSGYDTGIDNCQYTIFKLKPDFINSYKTQALTYWLKDIVSSSRFSAVTGYRYSGTNSLSEYGIRPRFLIG